MVLIGVLDFGKVMLDVSVIIINYNTGQLLCDCIDSIKQQHDVSFEIIVLDNDSADNSIALLKEAHPDVTLIENPTNVGFGQGNNIAANSARGKYLLLLNPDAAFSHSTGLSRLTAYAKENPQFGVIGAKIERSDNEIQEPYKRYVHEEYLKSENKNLPGDIAWVIGACLFIPRTVYEQVAGFDQDYFLYGEETDLCLRIRKADYEIGYCASTLIQHVGGASENKRDVYSLSYRKQMALQIFLSKHYDAELLPKLYNRLKKRATFRKATYQFLNTIIPNERRHRRVLHYTALIDAMNTPSKKVSS